MKPTPAIAALLAALFSFAATLMLWTSADAVETPRNADPPMLLSGAEIDYPPFSIVNADGHAGGFSVELMRAALAAMGRSVIFRTGPWADVRSWLEHGEIQALPLVGRTPERETLFDFTFPYMSLHGAVVVRGNRTDIHDFPDLQGKLVAVMRGDNAEEFLRREDRGIRIQTTTTFEEALRGLSAGGYDAVVVQRLVALRLIQETGLANLRVLNKPIEGFYQDFCFAVHKGDSKTLALLNEGLALVIADGTYRRLHAKWFAVLELPSQRRLVIGGDRNRPPFEYLDEKGRPAGFSVELTRAIAQEAGLDIEIRLDSWAEICQALARNEIDAVQGMLYSPERDRIFDFTQPYRTTHYVAVVRKGEGTPPVSMEELAGRRVVVQRGDIMHDLAIKKGLEGRLTPVDSQDEALQELAEGRQDCALVARMSALYWIKHQKWANLVLAKDPLFSAEYCYAVPKGHKALLAELGEGLKILDETGEYRRISSKWLGIYGESPPSLVRALRYSLTVLIPLVLILLAGLLWSWSLRSQVRSRTASLRKSENRFKELFESMNGGVAVYEAVNKAQDFVLKAFNRGGERIEQIGREQLLGKSVLQAFPGVKKFGLYDAFQRVWKTGRPERVPASYYADGRIAGWRENYVYKLDSGEIVAVYDDVTERKQAEEELKRHREQLEDLVKERTAALKQSMARLKTANNDLEAFAYSVSHDLRSPLRGVDGYSKLLLEDYSERLDEDGRFMLVQVRESASQMGRLIDDLLDFSRMGRREMRAEPCDMVRVVHEVFQEMREAQPGRRVRLVLGALPSCSADPAMIRQVVRNLLDNAVKFTRGPDEGVIEVGTLPSEEAASEIVYFVRDNGVGFDPRFVGKLFQVFQRLHRAEDFEGTGIGLALVRRIIRRHGGRVWAEGQPDQGATFYFSLPSKCVEETNHDGRELSPGGEQLRPEARGFRQVS